MKNIKLSDPLAVMAPYAEEIISAINRVVMSGWYIGGDEVSGFEKEFSQYLGVSNTVSTGTGTDAIQLALKAFDIKPGSKVVTVSHTAVATVAAIEMAGAIPVFADIDPRTFTIDPASLRKILEYHRSKFPHDPVRAVIPVHLYGHAADMNQVMKLADEFDTLVIEDCAQAHGASIDGKKCGTWGHAAAFSFYPTKNLGCLGDGGAMCTNNDETAHSARLIKEYGWEKRYISKVQGINTRLDSIQAAILNVRLKYLEKENTVRIKNAEMLSAGLMSEDIITPDTIPGYRHVFHQYVIRTKNRNTLIRNLESNGISTGILYPQPVHLQPAYKNRIPVIADLKITEQICDEILCLPVHPALKEDELQFIIQTLLK